MVPPRPYPYQKGIGWALLGLFLPLVWWESDPTNPQWVMDPALFLFWHSAAEVLAVVVAMLIFIAGYRAILSARKGSVVVLGVMFLGVGMLDFLHLFSYPGMPDAFSANTSHKAMFFWLMARVLAALALLLYALLPIVSEVTPAMRRWTLIVVLGWVGAVGTVGLWSPQSMPALFVIGQGLTPIKIGLELLVITLHLVTLAVLWYRRVGLAHECRLALCFAVALSAASEVFFTLLGLEYKDSANVIGHIYKLAAYLYLFHATFNEALQRPLERLQLQQLREKVALSAAPDGVLWISHTGSILMANPAMEGLTGYTPAELVGQNVNLFLPSQLREKHSQVMQGYFMAPQSRDMGLLDLKLQRRDGQMLPVDISLGHFEDEAATYAIAYIRDLSERKKFEESLRHQTTHDELTGLPNRWLFQLQLEQAMARAERTAQPIAVLFLDLDDFKKVNDGFGHVVGDALLLQVGKRMRGALRENDILARMGGDEFAVLLHDLIGIDEAAHVARKLLLALKPAYRLQNQDVYSGASVGIAIYPDDAQTSETLLRYADLAMYEAKASGRGNYKLYASAMDKKVHADMQLHAHLKAAMANGGLQLHYQPQVDTFTDEIVGAEALLRWFDPDLGQVSPARFIPVAETTGLILDLSDWVLDTACTQIAAWQRAGTPLRVAINVSAQQFRQRNLPEKVHAALQRTGAHARWLDIEITESVAMTQPDDAREQFNALVALGCRVALDDFGTGHSSLAYLKALPVHKIKIDKSFMDGVLTNANDAAITGAIMALAKCLGLALIAEGVETEDQRGFLLHHGCEHYQGWLFAKAMSAADMTALLVAAQSTPRDVVTERPLSQPA